MRKNIEFAVDNTPSPSYSGGKTKFFNHIIKEEYTPLKAKLVDGPNWFRLIPGMQIEEKNYSCQVKFSVLNLPEAKVALPSGSWGVFGHLYRFCKQNQPALLDSLKPFIPKEQAAFWVLTGSPDNTSLKLILGSNYDGSRGGAPGYIHEVEKTLSEADETGKLLDPLKPEAGRLICVTKTTPQIKDAYPSYAVKLGNNPAPLGPYIQGLSEEEFNILSSTPILNTIQVLSDDEQIPQILSANLCPPGLLEEAIEFAKRNKK